MFFREIFDRNFYFWQCHSALYLGISLLIGTMAAFSCHFALFLFLLFFFFTFYHHEYKKKFWQRLGLSVGMIFAGFFTVKTTITLPETNLNSGVGHLHIYSVVASESHHRQGFIYKGILKKFYNSQTQEIIAQNIPCQVFINDTWNRPEASSDYLISGQLKFYSHASSILKVDSRPWQKVACSFSLAELRFHCKNALKSNLEKHMKSKRAILFLHGIAAGIFTDPIMMKEFGNLGLQHIMAISGFHFSIIASFLAVIIRFFLSPKKTAICLAVLLFAYFLFIGPTASVERAFISCFIVLLSQLFEKKTFALNNLGIALIFTLIDNPFHSLNLGFQFSFLATAGILVLLKPMDKLMTTLFTRRSVQTVSKMNGLNQHAYIVLAFARSSLGLACAVHLVTIPLILYHFHQFPLLSLLYNLFFPLLASFSLILLILAFFVSWIPPLMGFIHHINAVYTNFILGFIEQPIHSITYTFYIENVSVIWLTCIYGCILLGGIFICSSRSQDLGV